jgi:hypothetical protein
LVDHREKGKAAAQNDPDVALMLRVKDGDAVAFTTLVETYQPRLIRVLRHIVGSDSVAEDLVQDVFLRVWRARKNYSPKAKFSTWIFHIAHNVASNSIRDRKRKKEFQVTSLTQHPSAWISLPWHRRASCRPASWIRWSEPKWYGQLSKLSTTASEWRCC